MVNGDGVYTTVGYTVSAAGYPPNYSPPGLPNTGSDIGVIALGGLALVAMGGAAAFATRRRSRAITE
ncbi:hypothetical protein BH24ACT9_BH24ACT9_05680 [soil metagenome]|jgi:LPXTG-motif cell wall-anchored protein